MTTSQNPNGMHFDTLFEHLPDPVVEFKQEDGEPIIVNANEAFQDVFAPGRSVSGHSLNELIVPADRRDEAKTFDERIASGESSKAVIERVTHEGRRKFLYRGVSVEDDRGFAIYSDVTKKLNQERYLDVLQRILRHNLRNKVNVINGQVKRALDTVENEEAREALEEVEEKTNNLTQLCTEAQEIRKAIGTPPSLEPIQTKQVANAAAEDCLRRFDQAEISVDCPDDLIVQADSRLRTVLNSLIDNAIRHNTSSLPEVTISTSIVTEDTVELAVIDNGPGIPETQRRVFTEKEEITPLSHGSGLGLWMVKWLTESYGGSMEINTPNDGGSIVRLRLPLANE